MSVPHGPAYAAPTGAKKFFNLFFYKYVAPTALLKWTSHQNAQNHIKTPLNPPPLLSLSANEIGGEGRGEVALISRDVCSFFIALDVCDLPSPLSISIKHVALCLVYMPGRSFWPWASFRLSYRVFQTCAFAKASPKSKNPRRPTPHLFCQCSNPLPALR